MNTNLLKKYNKTLIFTFLIIYLILNYLINAEVIERNETIFETTASNELIFDSCKNKYRNTSSNQIYEVRYENFEIRSSIRNLKCINSIKRINYEEKAVYIFGSLFLSNLFFYFAIYLIFFLKKNRFSGVLLVFLVKTTFDFYNYGYVNLGYPDILPLLFLYFFYEK